jgi:predicted short-subunit dehydrogenase-like oxidoreductase (DUF2520 family)
MDVAVVGAGRVGTAVAVLLRRAGHRIVAVSGRAATRDRVSRLLPDVPILDPPDAARAGELVLIAVPDDLIGSVVTAISEAGGFHPGQWVAHLSGATRLEVLDHALAAGASPLAVHPLQTFPDVEGAIDRVPGSTIAVSATSEQGYLLGERLADDLLASHFRLQDQDKPLYHAAAAFASNYLVAIDGIAEDLFRTAGVPDPVRAMLPLQRASVDNVERLGPAGALTGPAVRGDASTIELHLEALGRSAPDAIPVYIELCRAALALAGRVGRPADDRRAAVEEVLARWT